VRGSGAECGAERGDVIADRRKCRRGAAVSLGDRAQRERVDVVHVAGRQLARGRDDFVAGHEDGHGRTRVDVDRRDAGRGERTDACGSEPISSTDDRASARHVRTATSDVLA
jgi:hypothetical protein